MKKLENMVFRMNLIRKIKRLTIYNPLFMFLKNIWLFRKELWNFRTFDYKYNMDLFCRSLEHTRDFMASSDAVCESSNQTAEEIDDFLNAIDDFNNHVGVGIDELGYDFSPLWSESEEGRIKDKILLDRVHQIEEDSWERAMDLLKNRMRHWWD